MPNYRKICPACGSASVAYTTPLSIPLPVDRRCKACGTVWRMPRGITESIVAMLFGAALALYAGLAFFLFAIDFFLSERFAFLLSGRFSPTGLLITVGSMMLTTMVVIFGLSTVTTSATSLRQPRNSFRILRRGDAPAAPAEPPQDPS
jgi:hypothetical protein